MGVQIEPAGAAKPHTNFAWAWTMGRSRSSSAMTRFDLLMRQAPERPPLAAPASRLPENLLFARIVWSSVRQSRPPPGRGVGESDRKGRRRRRTTFEPPERRGPGAATQSRCHKRRGCVAHVIEDNSSRTGRTPFAEERLSEGGMLPASDPSARRMVGQAPRHSIAERLPPVSGALDA